MDLIEQAIYTSAETDRATGYQVVGASPGVCEADLRELATWGPSHDALLDPAPGGMSINFHALPSGSYCVSRTTPSGFEYSGRGVRIYTQCLIVRPSTLARFANNPFALLRAALANGAVRQYEKPPERMTAFPLAGRAAAVDSELLARLASQPGPEWMAALVQAALESACVAITGGPPADQVIAGLLNCLPPECRTEFSFSTGLKFSSRRPFRLVALPSNAEEQRRTERVYNLVLLRLNEDPPAEFAPLESWPRLIHRVLRSGRTAFLGPRLARRHLGLSPQELPLLGLQLLEELETSSLEAEARETEAAQTESSPANAEGTEVPGNIEPQADRAPSGAGQEKAPWDPAREPTKKKGHAAHPQFAKGTKPGGGSKERADAPSKHLATADPAVLEKFERLDDLVFDAIGGRSDALERLKALWPQLRFNLDETLLAESREQYLRYALSLWAEMQQGESPRDSLQAAQSLEVLCVLFDQV